MNLLLAGAENWILPGILLVLCVVLFVLYYFRNKKYQQNAETMSNNLKKGDKVKTYSGVYGTIVEIVQTDDGKVVTIETGNDKHKSYVSYDIRAVYAINEPEKPAETKTEKNQLSLLSKKKKKPKSFQKLLKQRQKRKLLLLKKRKQKNQRQKNNKLRKVGNAHLFLCISFAKWGDFVYTNTK